MKTKTKVLTLALCAVLLVVTTVFVTMAFLTSQDTVTNTFTVGGVAIELDEADIDNSKTDTTTEGRDKANNYHLIPGKEYTKDPTIHVDDASEDCWLFVKLENGLKDIIDVTTIEDQMVAKGWKLLDGTDNIYALDAVAHGGDDMVVFDSFKIIDDIDTKTLEAYASSAINVTAYAVQADGFDNAGDAWSATFGE